MGVILVTGATGRLGKFLVSTLLHRKEKIRAVIRPESKSALPYDVEPFKWDLSGGPLPSYAFEKVTHVIHLAGLVGAHPYNDLIKQNAYSTKNLLKNCPSSVQKIALASSISIYGEYKGQMVDENFKPKTESPYGKSKLLSEEFAKEFCPRLPVVFLRFGMIYGQGFEEGYFAVFDYLKRGKLSILGDGKNRLPFLHAVDAVQAILLSLESNAQSGRTYNIVGGEQMTQEEVIRIAAESLAVSPPKSHIPIIIARLAMGAQSLLSYAGISKKPRLDEENIRQMTLDRAYSTARASSELGFSARVKLRAGINEMAHFYEASLLQAETKGE